MDIFMTLLHIIDITLSDVMICYRKIYTTATTESELRNYHLSVSDLGCLHGKHFLF
jgi:hypothetical protein